MKIVRKILIYNNIKINCYVLFISRETEDIYYCYGKEYPKNRENIDYKIITLEEELTKEEEKNYLKCLELLKKYENYPSIHIEDSFYIKIYTGFENRSMWLYVDEEKLPDIFKKVDFYNSHSKFMYDYLKENHIDIYNDMEFVNAHSFHGLNICQ